MTDGFSHGTVFRVRRGVRRLGGRPPHLGVHSVARGRPELQKTLRLIVKHGNRREDSMWEILASGRCPTWDAAKTLYWTHLKKC